jgi:hypothetical protein
MRMSELDHEYARATGSKFVCFARGKRRIIEVAALVAAVEGCRIRRIERGSNAQPLGRIRIGYERASEADQVSPP